MWRCYFAVAVFAGGLSCTSIHAQTFTLASQNCLHLGQNDPTTNQALKNTTLQTQFSNYDVCLLQEVMRQANVGSVTPGSRYYITTPLLGASTYKEQYAFIVTNAFYVSNAMGANTTNFIWNSTIGGFSRVPYGILLKSGTNWTWLVDYHAVYGRTISVRRNEVNKMGSVYNQFTNAAVNGQYYARVIFGGDWNLSATDSGFTNLIAQIGPDCQILPNVPTSLTPSGVTNEPYDHFVWGSNDVRVTNAQLIPLPVGQSTAWWRANISDHLGICCTVAY